MLILARDLDGLDLGLLAHGLGDGDREHAVLQSGLHLVHLASSGSRNLFLNWPLLRWVPPVALVLLAAAC
jgi:hypothetical protein